MQSYTRGPKATIVRKTIGEAFLETADRFAERIALISRHQNIRLTWAEYAHQTQRVAAGLRALGLLPGDRVGVWATSCAEWPILQFGCALAGVVLVNVNPANRTHELSFVLRKSRMRALFLYTHGRHSNYKSILEESRAGQTIALEHVIYLDSPQWKNFLRDPDGITVNPDPDEPVNIQYTSGTTGQSKGVLLTHVNLVNNARFFAEYMRLTEQDRACVPVPMFHCFGCVIGTMTFDALATLEAIDAEQATVIYGVPAMFIAELQHPEFGSFQLNSLRTGIMAGSPCPIEIMRQVIDAMHCRHMVVVYGQTEASPGITSSHVDDDLETRCTTVGCALPETEVRIVSPAGETLPAGEQGELLARGYMVMKGYDDEPEATAQALDADGWLHTGDLALMRPDGYFKITGRARDMIIRGGENVYPREIEEFLYTHPAVADAQVIGIPDERLGEIVVAWIRLKAGQTVLEEEIRAFCRDRLAYYKVPQHIRFVESYPMTLSGKVQKFKMREFEISTRGLEAVANRQTA
jgi:fatty-acyl-CoA synthase